MCSSPSIPKPEKQEPRQQTVPEESAKAPVVEEGSKRSAAGQAEAKKKGTSSLVVDLNPSVSVPGGNNSLNVPV